MAKKIYIGDVEVTSSSKGDPGANGTNGVGISSIVQTTESTVSGGTNVITINKTDGTSSTFNVKNGDAVGSVTVVQATGDSTTSAMSQDGTTKAIAAGAQSVKTGTSIIFPNYSVTKLNATQVAALNAAEEITIKWVIKSPTLNMMYRYAELCGMPPYYVIQWSYFQTITVSPTLNANTQYLGLYVNGSTAASNSTWSNQCVVINRVTGRVRWYQNTTLLVDETSDDYKADYFISSDGYLYMGMGDYETRVYALQIYDFDVTKFWNMDNKGYSVSWTSGSGNDVWSTVKGNLLKYGYAVSNRTSEPKNFYGGNSTGRTVHESYNWNSNPYVTFTDGTAISGTSSIQLGYWGTNPCQLNYWNLTISGGTVSISSSLCTVYDSNGDEISDYTSIGAGDYLVIDPVVKGSGSTITYVSGSPTITETSFRIKAVCCVVDMRMNTTYDGKLIDNEAGTVYPFYKSNGHSYANCGTAWTNKNDAWITLSNEPIRSVYDTTLTSGAPNMPGSAPPVNGDILIKEGNVYFGDTVSHTWKQINNA